MAIMSEQMRSELNTLSRSFEVARWRHGHEPIIGSIDCDTRAEKYGDRGLSCYAIIVYQQRSQHTQPTHHLQAAHSTGCLVTIYG